MSEQADIADAFLGSLNLVIIGWDGEKQGLTKSEMIETLRGMGKRTYSIVSWRQQNPHTKEYNGYTHAVVYRGGKLAHNPHPNGRLGPGRISKVIYLLPIDPAKPIGKECLSMTRRKGCFNCEAALDCPSAVSNSVGVCGDWRARE